MHVVTQDAHNTYVLVVSKDGMQRLRVTGVTTLRRSCHRILSSRDRKPLSAPKQRPHISLESLDSYKLATRDIRASEEHRAPSTRARTGCTCHIRRGPADRLTAPGQAWFSNEGRGHGVAACNWPTWAWHWQRPKTDKKLTKIPAFNFIVSHFCKTGIFLRVSG